MLEGEESLLIMHKRRILPFVPIEYGTRRFKQMASLVLERDKTAPRFQTTLIAFIASHKSMHP
jgi:hypothetical protein